jgi:hypothetical protein
MRGGKPSTPSETDAMGRFDLKISSGLYTLRVVRPGLEVTTAELEVGKDF